VTTRRGRLVLAGVAGAAAVLLAVELALGAIDYGEARLADPCTAKSAFHGGGIDGALQRFALSGLNGAACRLHTSREELVLSLSPSARTPIRWNQATIDSAVAAGFERAAHDTAGNGLLGSLLASLLRDIVGRPVEWLLDR
jgi:hypothetical protein